MISGFKMPGNRSTARNLVSIRDVGTQANLTMLNSRVKSRQDAPVDDRRMPLRSVLHGDDNALRATHEVHRPAHFRYDAQGVSFADRG